MSIQCEFCKKFYASKLSLKNHQKSTKSCLDIQNELAKTDDSIIVKISSYCCDYCTKKFSSKKRLNLHQESCFEMFKSITNDKDKEINLLREKINEQEKVISELKEDNQNKRLEAELSVYKDLSVKSHNDIQKLEKIISEKDTKLQEIALTALEQKNDVIAGMVKKYVKKQPRKQFDCSNVVYILTTPLLKKEKRYILGKAKNLTNRLSTYNKTDEHEVIYYQDCGDEETMNALEPFIFKKLSEYREQANRERFILPENSDIDFFINTIKECFEFLK